MELGINHNLDDMNNTFSGIITKRFKYAYFAHEQREQLFDLLIDPYEMKDISKELSDVLDYHRGLLVMQF